MYLENSAVYVWQDTIEALMRGPDVMKSLREILRKVKDVPKILHRLQVRTILEAGNIY
jgi:DNA mismatch repair ATPase MutS